MLEKKLRGHFKMKKFPNLDRIDRWKYYIIINLNKSFYI